MHNRALVRLRVGFAALGVALLLPLFFLVRAAEQRFEEQRRLRHEIVAERIFDEMERELSVLLDNERARPSAAYDAEDAHVNSWAPFVVGYFTRDARSLQVLGKDTLSPGRVARVERVANALWPNGANLGADDAAKPSSSGARADRLDGADIVLPPHAELTEASKQSAVLNQLNRAANDRIVKQRKSQTVPKMAPRDSELGL